MLEGCGSMLQEQRSEERGAGKLNLVLTLAILGAMIFAAVKVVPVYLANYQFQDSIQTESKFALTGYPKKTADDVRTDVWNKAQELGIPADKDAIRVAMDNNTVEIGLDYSVPIDLSFYQFTLQFHPHADNHTI